MFISLLLQFGKLAAEPFLF
uniref:Uncharacterized protein n=1 Tax=Arundo donax TaxID=35708 RepID=A0A0A9HD31_ARUDO